MLLEQLSLHGLDIMNLLVGDGVFTKLITTEIPVTVSKHADFLTG